MLNKRIIHLLFSILLLAISLSNVKAVDKFQKKKEDTYSIQWQKVTNLETRGLAKSALQVVEEIYKKAKTEKNSNQLVKATIYRMKFRAATEEEAQVTNINDLKTEVSQASFPTKSILHSLLGEMYWSYYQQNRYKFLDRTKIIGEDSADLKTWDLKRIVQEVAFQFSASLVDSARSKTINMAIFDTIVDRGTESRNLRPSLFDFLAHRAVDFFKNNEAALPRSSASFDIAHPLYFSDAKSFAAIQHPAFADKSDFKRKAVEILQQLTLFRLQENNLAALIDLELNRLDFIYENSVHPQKDTLFLNALNKLNETYKENPLRGKTLYTLADFHHKRGMSYQPLISKENKWENKIALELCQNILLKIPNDPYAKDSKKLIAEITAKNLQLTLDMIELPSAPIKALVNYRNVKKIFAKIIEVSEEDLNVFAAKNQNQEREIYLNSLLENFKKAKALKTLNASLPDDGDYNMHSVELAIPSLPKGTFLILTGTDSSFKVNNNAITFNLIKISALSYFNKINANGEMEFFVTNRTSGAPMEGVNAQVWLSSYSGGIINKTKGAAFITDNNGFFKIPSEKNSQLSFSLELKKGDDHLLTGGNNRNYFYSGGDFYLSDYNNPLPEEITKTYFFTDRAIYRPGQTIYFKGIQVRKDKNGNQNLITNKPALVVLYDVNNQKISEQQLTLNDFGSFNSSFQLPAGGLTGQMRISDGIGDIYFSVEDYKRPTFEITFSEQKDSYQLNDTILLKASVKAYSGADIQGAEIKYRVVRNAIIPMWWMYERKGIYPTSPAMEITQGLTKTDMNGDFSVSFRAIPDIKLSKDKNPEYTYTVSVSATDANGETQNFEKSINIGYTTLKFNIDLPETVDQKDLKSLKVVASNLEGNPINAKGTLEIYKLQDPGRTIRKRNWERPDTFLYTKEQFIALFPEDVYAEEDNTVFWSKGNKIYSKNFEMSGSQNFELPKTNEWTPGKYCIEITSVDSHGVPVKDAKYFNLVDQSSKALPFLAVDWFSFLKASAEPEDKGKFLIGSSKEIKVLYELEKENKLLKREWLQLNNEQKIIEIPISEAYIGNVGVHLTFIYNNRLYTHDEILTVPFTNKKLNIEYETYRSKLEPGEKETWKIKITSKKGEKINAEMLATLYDASLNKFRENKFDFDVYSSSSISPGWQSFGGFLLSTSELLQKDWNNNYKDIFRNYDQLKTFGFNLYNQNRYMLRKGEVSAQSGMLASPKFESRQSNEFALTADGAAVSQDKVEKQEKKKETNIPFKTRTNFNETAFFYPILRTDEKGSIVINFTIPEALTRWKMLAIAHTQDLKYGVFENQVITQKELMATLASPRFFREGDQIKLFTKIDNLGTPEKSGSTEIHFFDTFTNKNIDSLLSISSTIQTFKISSGSNSVKEWNVKIPTGIKAITYRIKAVSGSYSDGEEKSVPVLSDQILVTESFPLHSRGKEVKKYTWDKFINHKSSTLKNYNFSFEFSSNPVWYAVQAIPKMMEVSNECTEQLFNVFYANSLAVHLVGSNPKIAVIFNRWKDQPGGIQSPLEKNTELKNILLEETPWVMEAKDETERQKRIALLFDLNYMSESQKNTLNKLKQLQMADGAWPWFKGMQEDRFITQYILTGLGRLAHLGINNIQQDVDINQLVKSGIKYLDNAIRKDFLDLKNAEKKNKAKISDNQLSPYIIQYLYARSFFKELPLTKGSEEAFTFYKNQAVRNWPKESIYMKGMIALALARQGDAQTPLNILKSLKEYALHHEEFGMYYKEEDAYYWYQAPIERQALLIELFDEVGKDPGSVEDLKLWLLKQKQTQSWKTSKATAEACYALLLKGKNLLEEDGTPQIQIGNTDIQIEGNQGTGYFKKSWSGQDISKDLGKVSITTNHAGVAWGSLYWQYFEKTDQVTAQGSSLSIHKKMYKVESAQDGLQMFPIDSTRKLKKGDLIKVKLEIAVDRHMEYVHLKDLRASGLEPVSVNSGYMYKDGLGFYLSTRDAATHFFIDHLPKGNYLLEYDLVVSHEGDFSNGMATLQCLYAPEFSAHSKGSRLKVEIK